MDMLIAYQGFGIAMKLMITFTIINLKFQMKNAYMDIVFTSSYKR